MSYLQTWDGAHYNGKLHLPKNRFNRLNTLKALGLEAIAAEETERADRLRELYRVAANEIRVYGVCCRCHGDADAFAAYPHVYSGECLRCGGTGLERTAEMRMDKHLDEKQASEQAAERRNEEVLAGMNFPMDEAEDERERYLESL